MRGDCPPALLSISAGLVRERVGQNPGRPTAIDVALTRVWILISEEPLSGGDLSAGGGAISETPAPAALKMEGPKSDG